MNKITETYKDFFSHLGEYSLGKWWVFVLIIPMFIYLGLKFTIAVIVAYGGALLVLPLLALPIDYIVNADIDEKLKELPPSK